MLCILLLCIIGEEKATTERAKYTYLKLALIPYFVLMAFKSPFVGTDTHSYFVSFAGMAEQDITNFINYEEYGYVRIEKGYKFLIFLLSRLTNDGQILLISLAAFSSIALYYFIKDNAKNKSLALFFFITLGFFHFAMTGIRQTFAMSVSLFCFKYIREGKLYKFLLVAFIATLFHKTAYLFFPMYYVAQRKIQSQEISITFGSMLVLFLFADKLLLAGADVIGMGRYGIESTGNGQIFFLLVLLITFYVVRSRRDLLKAAPSNRIFININFVSLALWTLRLVSRTAERASLYFMPYTYIVLEEFLITRKKDKRSLYIWSAIAFASYLFLKRTQDQGLDNFEFFFQVL